MARKNLIRLVLGVMILMSALHVLAVGLFLYWSYWWFDMPMHFLGGLTVGLFSLWVFGFEKSQNRILSSTRVLLIALLGVIVVGLAWEYFEYISGITFNAIGNYEIDTIKDLVMDVIGGYVAHLYFLIRGYNKG